MSWVNLFLAGLILALSPFNLHTDNYIFPYSILGFGLVAASFLFREKSWKDWTVAALAVLLVASGALNLFFFYYLFEILFFLSAAVFYAAESRKQVIFACSLVLTGCSSFLLAVHLGNSVGFRSFRAFVLNGHYFLISLLIAVILIDYSDWKNANKKTGRLSGQTGNPA